IGAPTYNQKGHAFRWSDDNLREIDLGIIAKADTIEQLAQRIGADPAVLKTTLDRWNALCEQKCDEDYGRPPGSMMPVPKRPFSVGELWPVVSNTQGGPVHNTSQQVLNVYGEP